MKKKFAQLIAGGISLACLAASIPTPILAETNGAEVIEQITEEQTSDQQVTEDHEQEIVQKVEMQVVEQEVELQPSQDISSDQEIEENAAQGEIVNEVVLEQEEPIVDEIQGQDFYASNSIQEFVARLYSNCIGRIPSESEVTYWEGRLTNAQETGTSIANFFANSTEVQQKNLSNVSYIQMLYRAFFGREADDGGLEYWLGQMLQGTSRQKMLDDFIGSNEYTAICSNYGISKGSSNTTVIDEAPSNYTPVQKFVYRFYSKCLGRTPDLNGINYWAQGLTNKQFTGQEIAYNFVNSSEFINKRVSNEEYINIMYRVFFNREADQGGRQYWLNILNSWTRQQVLDQFIISNEFYGICNSYDIVVLDEHAEITGFTRGTGTYENPYVITKPEQFAIIEENIDKVNAKTCFVLGNDISLQGIAFTPIGEKQPFAGHFDGKDHVIRKLTINQNNDQYAALFARTGSTAVISNIKLQNISITNLNNGAGTAGLVATNAGCIVNCHIEDALVKGRSYGVGGLVDRNDGEIYYSTFSGSCISDYSVTGGVVGSNYGKIDCCGAYATIQGANNTGGLIANNYGQVLNSFADCSITTPYDEWAGGLIGYDKEGTTYNCFSAGDIYTTNNDNRGSYAGGLVGKSEYGYFENCYAATLINKLYIGSNHSTGLLIGNSNQATFNYCYGCSGNASSWGAYENDRINCKILSLSQMQSDSFMQLLNSNVANGTWKQWTRVDGTNHALPYPIY